MTLRRFALAATAACALLSPVPVQSAAAERPNAPQIERNAAATGEATSVDAPPALLLFAMALGGIVIGRQMSRRARRKDDPDA